MVDKSRNEIQKWGNLSSQRIFECIIMTSLLADKSVKVKIKMIMNFMNEIINPPCNSLLATFFELNSRGCQKKASYCLKTLVSPKRTLSQLFELLFPLPLLISLKRKFLEREARRVLWEVRRDRLKQAVCAAWRLVRRQMWRTRTLMLLVALTKLSLGTSLTVSRSQKSFVERDLQRRVCPRVSMTPLISHNKSFQIFNIHI